jgi:hypothetical protein
MSSNVTIGFVFQTQSGNVPASQLDTNFAGLKTALNSANADNTYLIDTSGAPNVITVAVPSGVSISYVAGLALDIEVANTTTTGVPVINVGGMGNQLLVNADGSTLVAGQIVAAQVIHVLFDGTNFRLLSIGGATALTTAKLSVGPAGSGPAVVVATLAALQVAALAGNAAGWEMAGNGNIMAVNSFFVGQDGTGVANIFQRANTKMVFGVNGVVQMTLFADGGIVIGNPTGGDKGVGTINVQSGLYVNGTAITVP